MESIDVKRLGLILAIQAEIEGMKADNLMRKLNNDSLAYSERDFAQKADEIRDVVYEHPNNL